MAPLLDGVYSKLDGVDSEVSPDDVRKSHQIIEGIENTEHPSVEAIVREAVSRDAAAVCQVLDMIGLKREDLSRVLCGDFPPSRIQYNAGFDNGGAKWENERRYRTFFPDEVDDDDIFIRLERMSVGETIVLAPPLSESVLSALEEKEERRCITIDRTDPSGVISVCCLKKSIYRSLVTEAMRGLDYRLRWSGDIARKLHERCPDLKLIFQNIGNVPVFVKHPPFMILVELEKRFPGLWEKLQCGEKIREEELDGYFNHIMSAYPPTGGVPEFTEYVVRKASARAKAHNCESSLTTRDVLPVNGVADAITIFRQAVVGKNRILHVLPSYPVQTDMEVSEARKHDPDARLIWSDLRYDTQLNVWKPDFEDIENQLQENPHIRVISIIHPSNPTGYIWSKEDLIQLFKMAQEYNVLIESDETYCQIIRPDVEFVSAGVVASQLDVPCIVYRSASKDALECGGKFGWVEAYNCRHDSCLRDVEKALYKIKEEGVGATGFQRILPFIHEHPEYQHFLSELNGNLFRTADAIQKHFEGIDGVTCISPKGGMYTTVVFDEGVLNAGQTLSLDSPARENFVQDNVGASGQPLDERFLIYLIAKTGVVPSPLSGFRGKTFGFRVCNFEFDLKKINEIYGAVASAVREYLASTSGGS